MNDACGGGGANLDPERVNRYSIYYSSYNKLARPNIRYIKYDRLPPKGVMKTMCGTLV